MAAKRPEPVTERWLRNVLRWYLERYDAPADHVRRLLLRRAERVARLHDQDLAACAAMVARVVEDAVRSGAIDDRRYATSAVRAARARGVPARRIALALGAKGVPTAIVRAVLAEEADETEEDPERLAAIRYARRRRFGPWRRGEATPEVFRKELASLVRAGFAFDLAREILRADDAEALEAELPVGW